MPSIQIGSLKAYLRAHLPEEYRIYGHHFHLSITTNVFDEQDYAQQAVHLTHEATYLELLLRAFGDEPELKSYQGRKILSEIEDHCRKYRPEFSLPEENLLTLLQTTTDAQLDEHIVQKSSESNKVIVGFTTNFTQTYANIYAYFYLRRKLGASRMTAVFGGSSVSYPNVLRTMRLLGIDAYVVIGEGETKLHGICNRLVSGETIEDPDNGILHVKSTGQTAEWNQKWFASQIKSMKDMPIPDYEEYFLYLNSEVMKKNDWPYLLSRVQVPLEGSRGCVFACEFCNLNRFWEGYRKLPGEVVAERAIQLADQYKVKRVHFVDNLCDGWAEAYADTLIKKKRKILTMMEMRPKHTREFWEKLAASGLEECQIGVEGLDEEILKRVKKGTTLMDILFSQKNLIEVFILKGSRQIISYYPLSSMEEVKNTRHVLEATLHMPKFEIFGFGLMIDSPIYKSLPVQERQQLPMNSDFFKSFPASLNELNVFFNLVIPESVRPKKEVEEEWARLSAWYKSIDRSAWMKNYLLINGSEVIDCREKEVAHRYLLTDEEALVYECCHEPVTHEDIVKKTNLSEEVIGLALEKFRGEHLVFCTGDKILALALRISEDFILGLRDKKKGPLSRTLFV
jgi:hypothetical protein